VPTTAGTGSEATPVAVVADATLGMKVGISSPHLIPRVAVCDPELTITCPPEVTAAAGADALAHCVESLTARQRQGTPELPRDRVFVGRSRLTDTLALQGISALVAGLQVAYRDPTNLSARTETMYASLLGGLAFGTAGTAAAHALQYPIGVLTGTAHGVGVGCLLPYVMAYNQVERLEEMAAIARIFGASGPDGDLAGRAPHLVRDFLSALGIPRTLSAIGVSTENVAWIAEQGVRAVRLSENNPRTLTLAAASAVVAAAVDGDLDAVPAAEDQ
jgi:alcohol dehydrogenase